MHAFKLSKLNEEENETPTISNFLHLSTLHVAKKFSFNLLKTISLKIKKKTTIEVQIEGEVKATWPIDKNESKKDALSEARDFCESFSFNSFIDHYTCYIKQEK